MDQQLGDLASGVMGAIGATHGLPVSTASKWISGLNREAVEREMARIQQSPTVLAAALRKLSNPTSASSSCSKSSRTPRRLAARRQQRIDRGYRMPRDNSGNYTLPAKNPVATEHGHRDRLGEPDDGGHRVLADALALA
jgi:hypothetical protein